jgi:hypothetical protein
VVRHELRSMRPRLVYLISPFFTEEEPWAGGMGSCADGWPFFSPFPFLVTPSSAVRSLVQDWARWALATAV